MAKKQNKVVKFYKAAVKKLKKFFK